MSSYRERLEAFIEEAIALLDQIDGDADFEDDGTLEPSIDPSIAFDGAGRWFWTGKDMEGDGHAA
ncbi:MAG: hypothetical protein Devi2KO_31630 [Devosia indica]